MAKYDASTIAGKAIKVGTELYNRNPFPKWFEMKIPPGITKTLTYRNGTSEVSEVKRIRIKAAPDVLIAIRIDKDNQAQGVVEQRRVADLPIIDGIPTLEFRSVSADVPLSVGEAQSIYVDISHNYAGNQLVKIGIDKQAVRFYRANLDVTEG